MGEVRSRLGDTLFSDFIIDIVSENGFTTDTVNLSALADIWIMRRKKQS